MDEDGTTRRGLLRGALGAGVGLALARPAFAERKDYASREGPAKGVIQIFLPGGLAHQDSFDPKPDAPLEYRGETTAIPTALDGVQLGSHLARTAKIADRLCICRAVTHNEAAHERGVHNVLTGVRPSPALVFPSLGSVVAHELGSRGALPPYVAIPNLPSTYAGPGYLSAAFAPFALGSDPAAKDFAVRDLAPPKGVDAARFARRRELLDAMASAFREGQRADALEALRAFYEQAYALVGSPEARAAFDLEQEPAKLRDAYGRHAAGQRLLLARRLVEHGVRFVTVSYGSWDHHDKVREGLARQLPPFDQAFAALIGDLEQRGLLDQTLVLVTTEFGRTPKLNATGGRDHWPKVFSLVLAGGGFKRGYVHGASDATAGEPRDGALSIADWATTVYHQVGIVADKELMAPGGRPVEIVDGGRVVRELLA